MCTDRETRKRNRMGFGQNATRTNLVFDAIGLSRQSTHYAGNMVRRRPPRNSGPKPEGREACVCRIVKGTYNPFIYFNF